MWRLIPKRILIEWVAKKMWPGCGYETEEKFEGNIVHELKIHPTRNGKYL